MTTDKHIPDPGFAGDDGGADPGLADALAAWAAGGDSAQVLAALLPTRLVVPVIAVATDMDRVAGADKATDMALPTITGADGRRAVPAFTSLATMAAWRADARPVPVTATTAALATVAEDAQLLVIDAAGPVTFGVEGPALRALAQSRLPMPPHQDPEVIAAVREVVEADPALVLACLWPAAAESGADTVLGLMLATDAAVPEAPVVANRIAQALAEVVVLRVRVDRGLDLALLPTGAALPVPGPEILLDRRGLIGSPTTF